MTNHHAAGHRRGMMVLLLFTVGMFPGRLISQGKCERDYCCNQDGKKVYIYTLSNGNGIVAKLSNYGGVIFRLDVPDKSGHVDNVVLGLDSISSYFKNNPHFGALIGRFSNRIANAEFTIDGNTYHLTVNSHGKNSIHGGRVGFDKIVWDSRDTLTTDGPALVLTHMSPDGHEGFPGNLFVTVTYTLTFENELKIEYTATTDKPTVVNFTNHCYFNLTGEGSGNVLNHEMMIDASAITPVDDAGIPTGNLAAVAGTPYDFRKPKPIGADMNALPRGYDINYVLNHDQGVIGLACRAYDPISGRMMEVFTSEPGMQFFTANGFNGMYSGESGRKYYGSYGFCCETEHFPDSPNKPGFPSTVLRPGEEFHSTTLFRFSTHNR